MSRSALRASDILAQESDGFVTLLPEVQLPGYGTSVASKRLEVAQRPVLIKWRACQASVGIGIRTSPLHGDHAQTLPANADAAMDRAKEVSKKTYRIWQSPSDRDTCR